MGARVNGIVLASLLGSALVAGCGAGSRDATEATVSGAAGSASTVASNAPATTSGSSPSQAQFHEDLLAFARCMRASGVPNFPDPKPGGGFSFDAAVSAPAFERAQARCRKLLPDGGAGPPFSPQALVQLRGIAACMRQHGVPAFPDPKRAPATGASGPPAGAGRVTDYHGVLLAFPATLDTRSPAFERAATECGGGFLNRR